MSNRLNEAERHAVAHAQYCVDRATPDNPDVCFDYELVASLLGLINRLTAAAEVGEQYPNDATRKAVGWDRLSHADKVLWNEATERCAQVAEAYDGPSGKHGIAAAIRALKDKP